MLKVEEDLRLKERSRKLRVETFDLSREHGGYHFGGSLSAVEILVSLYENYLKPNEDMFILSKGHAAFSWYPLLRERGFNPKIAGHPDIDIQNGIYCTTGSLGMGFPTGAGYALSKKTKKEPGRIYVLMGEAELQEGTTWETLLIANKLKLNNLIGIIDKNNHQNCGSVNNILPLGDLEAKLKSFGAAVYQVDGHSFPDLIDKYELASQNKEIPSMIVANTIKGKGISFMEHEQDKWHARFPHGKLEQVYQELGSKYGEIPCQVEFKKNDDLRNVFGETITELAERDPALIILNGDYESSLDRFKTKFPDRCINLGTTEQSTVSMASAMALTGLRPVVYSIAPFVLQRPSEQVKIGIDQQNARVMLVGHNDNNQGPTHIIDNAKYILGSFPNIRGFFPENKAETRQAVIDAYEFNGPSFILLKRDYNI